MAASRQIIDLRNLLAERFQQSTRSCRRTNYYRYSCLSIERPISGGLGKGAITEIISPNTSAGSALLIHSLLQIAQRDRFFSRSLMDAIRSMSNPSMPPPCNTCFGSVAKKQPKRSRPLILFCATEISPRPPRSGVESGGRIAPHSSDELVSLATIGRASADRICGIESPQHGGERPH